MSEQLATLQNGFISLTTKVDDLTRAVASLAKHVQAVDQGAAARIAEIEKRLPVDENKTEQHPS